MISASTQPPPTEPISRPSEPTSILVPAGTGVEPRTRATVANAPTPPPLMSSAAAFQTFMRKKLSSRSSERSGSPDLKNGLLLYHDRAVHPLRYVDGALVGICPRDQRCRICAGRLVSRRGSQRSRSSLPGHIVCARGPRERHHPRWYSIGRR